MQQQVVQTCLDLRAVPGSSQVFAALGLSADQETALCSLVEAGWAKQVDSQNDFSYQLTMKTLQLFTVQFGLESPFAVFQRRPDLVLVDATAYELVMELQHMGFTYKEIGRQKKTNPYFAEGALVMV